MNKKIWLKRIKWKEILKSRKKIEGNADSKFCENQAEIDIEMLDGEWKILKQ